MWQLPTVSTYSNDRNFKHKIYYQYIGQKRNYYSNSYEISYNENSRVELLKEALEYAEKVRREENREVTFEEMQQFAIR